MTEIDVAVNLLWMAPGRVGGSEEYLTRQLTGLDPAHGCAPTLYGQPSLPDAHPELTTRFPTRTLPFGRDWRPVRILAEHTWLAARTRRADVVHHGGGTAPLIGRRPVVLTIHDLQYIEFPEYFSPGRRRYLATMMPQAVRRAAVITTPSEFVRSTVIDAFEVDPERVVVVPHGVPEPERPDGAAIERVLAAHGLADTPFVVYPAITHPHKGHRLMVDMADHLPAPMAVVLVGGEGAAEHLVVASMEASAHRGRIIRTGRVPAAHRDALLAGAAALVFPSEYEGFGAPLVEAMALGTPVVAGDAPAVREVVADAAEIVTERSGAAWAEAVHRAVADRERLIDRGHRRREHFTTDVSGRALASAYRLAVEAPPATGSAR